MHRNIVQHICIAASKLKYARNVIVFLQVNLIYTSNTLHQPVKIHLFHFRINSLTCFWCCVWEPRGMYGAEVLGVWVCSWPCVVPPCCHLLAWPLFCWYLVDFVYRLLLPYCMIFSLWVPFHLLLLPLSCHARLPEKMGDWDPHYFDASFSCLKLCCWFCVL